MMYSTRTQTVQAANVWSQPTRTYDYPYFNAAPNLGLAITQLVLGFLCVIMNIVQIALISATGYVAIGIWGGIPMIIAGVFGIAATKSKGKCAVGTTLIISVISAIIGVGVFVNFAAGVAIDSEEVIVYFRYAKIAIGVSLMIFGMSEMVIGIVQAVFCGKAMNMGSQTNAAVYPTGVLANQQDRQHNQQIYTYINGQIVPWGVMSHGVLMPTNQLPTGQLVATTYIRQPQDHLSGASQVPDTLPPAYTGPAGLEANFDLPGIHNSKY